MTQILKRAYFLRKLLWFLSVGGHIRKCQSGKLRFERLLHGETESTLLRSRDLALHQLLTLIIESILIRVFLHVSSSLPTLLPPRETGILFPSHQTENTFTFRSPPSLHPHSSHPFFESIPFVNSHLSSSHQLAKYTISLSQHILPTTIQPCPPFKNKLSMSSAF